MMIAPLYYDMHTEMYYHIIKDDVDKREVFIAAFKLKDRHRLEDVDVEYPYMTYSKYLMNIKIGYWITRGDQPVSADIEAKLLLTGEW